MGVVTDRIDADRAGLREVVLIYFRGRLVGLQRVYIPAETKIDVAGHMHDVPGAWHRLSEPVGIRLGAFRTIRRLYQMDVEVDGPRVLWVFGQHPFQALLDIGGAALRLP